MPISASPVFRTLATLTAITALGAVAAPAAVADIAAGPANLTNTFRGEDGSALYTRAIGSKVVGFGEDANSDKAFVFEGTRSGVTISGRWWDVAKGSRDPKSGELKLTFSNNASLLQRSGGDDLGPDVWQVKAANQMIWPKSHEAGFQSTRANDLDGAFSGDDGSRAYVRQSSTDVVWFAEKFVTQNSSRPSYATVGIGTRTDTGVVAQFYDIPKGTQTLRSGLMIGTVGSSPRTFTQKLHDAATNATLSRASSYSADYAVDIPLLAQQIEQRLAPFVVGFAYSIAADRTVVKSGAGGVRRIGTPSAEQLPFTPYTVNEIASASKTVTAVAVARALHQRGLTLDAKVDAYLPAQWSRGSGMKTVTFRQLLAHGGLQHPGKICDDDPYKCLEQAVDKGMVATPGYNNIHYTIFRLILPFVTDKTDMQELFATQTDESEINEAFSAEFRDEIRATLLAAGVDADFAYAYGAEAAHRYDWGPPATLVKSPTGSEVDYLEAGSGGLKMHAVDYVRFLADLEAGFIIQPALVQEIKELGFGGTSHPNGSAGSAVGPLYGKAGGAGGTGTYGMVFPGNVQVFISRNSTGHPTQADDSVMLEAAWEAALINAS